MSQKGTLVLPVITLSILPIDIQHEIQHTNQRSLYSKAFLGYFKGFDSCSNRQQEKTAHEGGLFLFLEPFEFD